MTKNQARKAMALVLGIAAMTALSLVAESAYEVGSIVVGSFTVAFSIIIGACVAAVLVSDR